MMASSMPIKAATPVRRAAHLCRCGEHEKSDGNMKVKRIMSNTATSDLKQAAAFYGDMLGLELLMDHGWFQTFGSDEKMTVQMSFGSEGGSGTSVPDLSIEIDDLEAALTRFEEANVRIEYGPVSEPWGVRRFYVRDPFGESRQHLAA